MRRCSVFFYVDVSDPDYEEQLADILEDMQSAVVLLGTEMMEAVECLAEKGHERIGYLRGEFRIQAFRSREPG